MTINEYGSVEYFKELFSDVIANIEDPVDIDNVLTAFDQAIEEWSDYHSAQFHRYQTLLARYRRRSTDLPRICNV